MKSKILLAIDGSGASIKAARYVASLLGSNHNVSVTLFHVLTTVPPDLLEAGTLEGEEENKHREGAWEEAEHEIECKCLEPVIDILKQTGFREEQIQRKHFAPLPGFDVAHVILKECERGDYDTVVLGKRGTSRIGYFLIGGVTEKVVRHSKGMAVWIIE